MSNMLKKFKLKKKWRFWRSFKFIFFIVNKKSSYLRFKFDFNNKRILWKQYLFLYGKIRKSSLYKKHLKYLFGVRFFDILSRFETRLDVILVRLSFCKNIKVATEQIKLGKIYVNNKKKNKWYLLKPKEIINKEFMPLTLPGVREEYLSIYEGYSFFNQIATEKRILTVNPFRHKWSSFFVNYLEFSFRFKVGLLLRLPIMGEQFMLSKISYKKKKFNVNMSCWFFFKKLYFLY